MTAAYRIATCAAGLGLGMAACGCGTTIPPAEFISRYTTNIEVPNPGDHRLPVRVFKGLQGRDFVIQDIIPSSQGGGVLGKSALWRCPKQALPADFPAAYAPADLMVDGRSGAEHRYLAQSYVPPAVKVVETPAATQPASETAAKDE